MTDLQASLFFVGGAIIIGVISYNKWQEYKAKKNLEQAFSSPSDEVLMASSSVEFNHPLERHEPRLFDAESAATPLMTTDIPQDPELTAEQLATEPQSIFDIAGNERLDLPIDALIDSTIPLVFDASTLIRGSKALPILQSLCHAGNKPVSFIGQDDQGQWGPVIHSGVYKALMAGVQMANRSGALNEIEYSELVMSLRRICDVLGAEPEVPDMTEVIRIARSLHHFVTEHDVRLGVNIQSKNTPWVLNTLLPALTRQGFDKLPDGRLVMPDGDNGVLFSLLTNAPQAQTTTSCLTLLLDAPRVAQTRDGYGAMIACARSLASRLHGVIVDDSNQPLADAQLGEIAGQVDAFYRAMSSAEIPAGSARALRLFS